MKIPFTTTGVVYELKSHCNPSRASNSPDSSHSFHSAANSSFPAKITWCNLHAPSRCRGWWMPTIHTRPPQIQHKSTFIAGDNHYVLFYKISFCTDPVNLFGFGFNVSAERKVYCLVFTPYYLFLGYCYALSMFHVCFILLLQGCRSTESRVRSNLPSLWLCRALRQTIIFCIAICRLPQQMIDVLNRMSGPHINKQAHSWVCGRLLLLLWTGMELNNICLLHQALVFPLPMSVS